MINVINLWEKSNEEIIKDLETKKLEAVNSENFEEAIKIRDQIKKLKSQESNKEQKSKIIEEANQIKSKTKTYQKKINTIEIKTNNNLIWQLKTNNWELEKKDFSTNTDESEKWDWNNKITKGLNTVNNILNESELKDIALKKTNEAIRLLTELNGLRRLKKYDASHFYENYNWKVNNLWYLYNKQWKLTIFLPSQISTSSTLNWYQDKKDAIIMLNKYLNSNNFWKIPNPTTSSQESTINEVELKNIALKKINEAVHFFTQLNGLKRLKKYDTSYFNENYNWKVNNLWYLYNKQWKLTIFLPSQIRTSHTLNWDQDKKDAIIFIKSIFKIK